MSYSKIKLVTIIMTIFIIFISISNPLLAEEGDGGWKDALRKAGGQAYYGQTGQEPTIKDPAVIVGRMIQTVMGFLGLLFTVLILYSGFQWMTAGGNQDTIGKARQRIINAVIGLVISLAVFGITTFVLQRMFITTGLYTS